MYRTSLLARAVVATIVLLLSGHQLMAAENRPNIVFILADDLGWKDLGCYGSTFYETPNIDKLAKSGVRFTDAYAAAPLCSATRAAILTGWSPARQHLIGVTPHSRKNASGFKDYTSWKDKPEYRSSGMPLALSKQLAQLHPDHSITIAERLKEKGYATAFIGKWHLGPDADKYPEKHGFDINIAGSNYGWPHSYFSPYKVPNLKDGPADEHLTDRLTDESLAWMEKLHKEKKPFFLYFSHFSVHGPWQSKDEYTEYFESKVDANDKQRNSVYAGMIKTLDDSVGRVMDKVRSLGIDKNTLVILVSDNGGIAMEKKCRVTGKVAPITSMHPLRGEKALLYEGGVRVPCIISMPGTVKAGQTSNEQVNSVDFYPTLLDFVGLTKKEDNPLDGQSLLAHVKSGVPLKRDYLTWFMPANIKAGEGMDPCATIRQGNHKYITFFDGRKELYDLSKDIGETKNLADATPGLCKKLDALLMKDLKSKNAHIPIKNPHYKGPTDGKKPAPTKRPVKGETTEPAGKSVGDFKVFNGTLTQDGKLGYTLTADAGKIAWALKPLGTDANVVQIKSSVRIRANAKTANAFLAIGHGTDPKKVLKLGIYYGKKTICIQSVSMPRAAVGTYAAATLKKGGLISFTVTIDQAKRVIAVDMNGNKLTTSFPKQIKTVTHAGYANIRSAQECTPLKIVTSVAAPVLKEPPTLNEPPVLKKTAVPQKVTAKKPELWVHPYVCKGGFFGPLRDDYTKVMSDATQWKDVLSKTKVVGFHSALLGRYRDEKNGKVQYRATDEQLRRLAAFYKKHNLKVNIEIGGVRYRPQSIKAGKAGVGRRYAKMEMLPLLERWQKAGGSIDYLTTDHAVMMRWGAQLKGKTQFHGELKDNVVYSLDELIKELAESLAEVHKAFPEAKFGIAESIGHFRIKDPDNGRTYLDEKPNANTVDLPVFLEKMESATAKAGVKIDHFMIDYQIQAAYRDANGKRIENGGVFGLNPKFADQAGEIKLDLGRAAAAAKISRADGLRVIFQLTPGSYGFGVEGDPDSKNNQRAFQAIQRMANECTAADIQPDAIIFECWQPHPSRTGPETGEYSFMHNVLGSIPVQAPSLMAAADRPPSKTPLKTPPSRPGEKTSETSEFLARYLKKNPASDADKDGILTGSEFKAHKGRQ